MTEETNMQNNGAAPEKQGTTPMKKQNNARPGARRYTREGTQNGGNAQNGGNTQNAGAQENGKKTGDPGQRRGRRQGTRAGNSPRRDGNTQRPDTVAERANSTPVASVGGKVSDGRKSEKRRRSREGGGADAPLRVISLGGLGEIGKNMTVLEWKDTIVIIDCGVAFPDEDMLGIDLVIPDITYLLKNREKVKGIVVTHGHEDHIGSIPYILGQLNVPVYCTRLTAGILANKVKEARPPIRADVRVVEAGDTVRLGAFSVEFIHVNHSIPDACALAISTPVGMVFHTGDFKLDTSPIDGRMMDLTRIGEIGNAGVLLMMGESTNAERPGYTPSESTVGTSFETIFTRHADKRVVIATFSSNVHRVQQIIDAAVRHKRKVAIMGRSMVNIVGAANELGYMHVPEGTLIDTSEMKRYRPNQLCLITTGSQGEPMSALYRMAFGESDRVKLTTQDIVVLSSHPIPGNEKLVGKVINTLTKNGIEVHNTGTLEVHVSGHACQEELKLMLALVRPKYFMPVHGESRHLAAHKSLALGMGIPAKNIAISDIGRVLEVTRDGFHFNGTVPSGSVFIDGAGVGDVGAVVLRERKTLGEEGVIVVAVAVDFEEGTLLSRPEVQTKGFVYEKDANQMIEGARALAEKVLERYLGRRRTKVDENTIKTALKDELQKYCYRLTKRSPLILPILL